MMKTGNDFLREPGKQMATSHALEDLSRRIVSGYPILVTYTLEERRWERELKNLADEMGLGFTTWSLTAGTNSKGQLSEADPVKFFEEIVQNYEPGHLFLIKDLHRSFDDFRVVRRLRDLIQTLIEQRKTLILIGPNEEVPVEISKDVAILDLPMPGVEEFRELIQSVIADDSGQITVQPTAKQVDSLVNAVLGLTIEEARKALVQALQFAEEITDDTFTRIVSEKRRMVQGSNLLEFFDLDEGIEDVGGLDGLKDWIIQRSEAFSADAQDRGIANPKGVLLAGVQGCGKSLSAKAIAKLLHFPLVRMDLGNLLESGRGMSEQNLRDVLHVMETIAPSVLWLEEIDKAFAGFVGEEDDDPTISRIVGRFLTWLQEHTAPVFVVATANRIANLPPELLRRGRFDELFFVDLPTFEERISIFQIHLKRRGWKPDQFDLEELSNETDQYSGAEIETIVNSAIIESYAEHRLLTNEDLFKSIERTVPLSVTMEDEIFNLREWARTRCRPATLDHRVIRVMEEETRRGEAPGPDAAEVPKWLQLVQHGQIPAAVVDYIQEFNQATWEQLLAAFEPYTDVRGQYGLVLRSDPKIVIWNRMSKSFVDVLLEFIAGRRVYLHPVVIGRYPEESRIKLPVIEELPEERLNSPVWMPTELRLLPRPEGSGRFGRVARIKMGSAKTGS